ncbi:MAG: NUDIX hydrolase, partial [Cyanobacteria bacterium J083]
MNKLSKWQILKSQFVINNRWCKVRQDKIQLTDGTIVEDYFVNVRPDIVLIVPITAQGEIVLVRQYRHGVEQILLELPAGTFEREKENSQLAALRELREETGYQAQKIVKLAEIYDNPVKDTNKIYIYLAKDLIFSGKQVLDPTEAIEVILVPLKNIKRKIFQGEISVSGSITAIFLALDYLE